MIFMRKDETLEVEKPKTKAAAAAASACFDLIVSFFIDYQTRSVAAAVCAAGLLNTTNTIRAYRGNFKADSRMILKVISFGSD